MKQADTLELLRLMHGIVTYEKGTDFALTQADLGRWEFGPQPLFGAFVAEAAPEALAGMAAYYVISVLHNARPLLMLKWLYVDPKFRGGEVGRLLMQAVARYAQAQGHESFCWFVLKDNGPAQDFYRSLGAQPDANWDYWNMPATALAVLAA